MSRYTKRPVTIEARQHDGTEQSATAIAAWIDSCGGTVEVLNDGAHQQYVLHIGTPEGTMCVSPSWWVIQGVEGEFYPCQNSVFELTYEPEMPKNLDELARGWREVTE